VPCNIEARAGSIRPLNWHVACCVKCMTQGVWAAPAADPIPAEGVLG
jgi:hypothetical protein